MIASGSAVQVKGFGLSHIGEPTGIIRQRRSTSMGGATNIDAFNKARE
jgi:hypothetical protein